jgi:hypothetical protein
VSNIQTGSFSGPVGSDRGTHRHRPGMTVRTAQPTRRLYTPSTGMVEARLRATADPTCMLAVWLVGFEEAAPEQSGEICIAELYGHALGPGGSRVRLGIKAHHDPRLREDMTDVPLGIDASDWHTYAAAWTAQETRFSVDDRLVRTLPQGLDYPLQLMIDLFEFPTGPVRDPAGRCCIQSGRGTLKQQPTYRIRSPGRVRRTRRSAAGSLVPRRPVRSDLAEDSGRTHAQRSRRRRCGLA